MQRKKVIEEIEEIELGHGISVEKITTKIYINDELISQTSESHYLNNSVENGKIILFDKDVREIHRQKDIYNLGDEKLLDYVYKYSKNPFDKIVSMGDDILGKTELLIDKRYDHTLRTLDGIQLPKRIYFDYMSGIKDGHYDLNKLLEHLKTVESIELLSNVITVPYYNSSNGCKRQIEFYVRPMQEEWDEILKCEVESYFSSDKIKNQIKKYYGFDKFEIEFNYDEDDDY